MQHFDGGILAPGDGDTGYAKEDVFYTEAKNMIFPRNRIEFYIPATLYIWRKVPYLMGR